MSPSEQAAGVWVVQWFLCLVSNAADFLALAIRASWVVRPLPGSDHRQQKLSPALATLPTTIHPDTVSLPGLCTCPAEPASGLLLFLCPGTLLCQSVQLDASGY